MLSEYFKVCKVYFRFLIFSLKISLKGCQNKWWNWVISLYLDYMQQYDELIKYGKKL